MTGANPSRASKDTNEASTDKAHRRVKVRESDWGTRPSAWQGLGKQVGTYGVASATYWWSRLAAAVLVRLCHYFLADAVEFELLLYSDDFIFIVMDFPGMRVRWRPSSRLVVAGGPFLMEEIPGRLRDPVGWIFQRGADLPDGHQREECQVDCGLAQGHACDGRGGPSDLHGCLDGSRLL